MDFEWFWWLDSAALLVREKNSAWRPRCDQRDELNFWPLGFIWFLEMIVNGEARSENLLVTLFMIFTFFSSKNGGHCACIVRASDFIHGGVWWELMSEAMTSGSKSVTWTCKLQTQYDLLIAYWYTLQTIYLLFIYCNYILISAAPRRDLQSGSPLAVQRPALCTSSDAMGSGASALPERAGLIVEPPELEREEYIKEHHKCLCRVISAVDFCDCNL